MRDTRKLAGMASLICQQCLGRSFAAHARRLGLRNAGLPGFSGQGFEVGSLRCKNGPDPIVLGRLAPAFLCHAILIATVIVYATEHLPACTRYIMRVSDASVGFLFALDEAFHSLCIVHPIGAALRSARNLRLTEGGGEPRTIRQSRPSAPTHIKFSLVVSAQDTTAYLDRFILSSSLRIKNPTALNAPSGSGAYRLFGFARLRL